MIFRLPFFLENTFKKKVIMRTKIAVAGLLVVGLFSWHARAEEKLLLKLRLEKSAEYAILSKTESSTHMMMGDSPMDMTSMTEMDGTMVVADVDALGIQTINTTFTAVRFKMGGPISPMELDSTKDKDVKNPMFKPFLELVNKTTTMKLDENYKPKDDEPIKNIGELSPKMGDAFTKLGAWMPSKPLSIGESWDYTADVGEMVKTLKMKIVLKSTLKERKDGIAHFEISGSISGQMEGSIAGKMAVDEKTGQTIFHEMEMKMSQAIGEEKTKKQTIEVVTKTTTTYTKK